MMILIAHSCEHLKPFFSFKSIEYELQKFADGEICVTLQQDVAGETVWVIAATNYPAEHFLELLFLLDALYRAGAKIKLLLTYFGYERQDRYFENQALSAEVLFRCLRQFSLHKTIIIHAHSIRLKLFFDFENIILFDFFSNLIKVADILVAPDAGAAYFVQVLGDRLQKQVIILEKKRMLNGHVTHQPINQKVKNKKIFILDDMISTGHTVINAAHLFAQLDAQSISVAATHGLMTKETIDLFTKSPVDKVYLTNTLPQAYKNDKITIINCSEMFEQFL